MNDQIVFRILRLLAENCFDGHFTVMKFTTEWRVSFGPQPETREEIAQMAKGASLMEAFVKAVESAEWPENPKRTIKSV